MLQAEDDFFLEAPENSGMCPEKLCKIRQDTDHRILKMTIKFRR